VFETTLSIDLGASYTKLSYRLACVPAQTGTIQEEAKVLMIDNSPLVPSLAIRTRSATQPWIFGRQAAPMNPNQEMQVFQNWKAHLFHPQNDKDSVTAAIIAHRFFEWLRSKLELMGIDVKKCQTRIAMPAFDTFDENAVLLARCMDLSGWNDPTLILKVREPHANTLGLFTNGRNAVRRNAAGENWASKAEMFDDGVYQNNLYMRTLKQYLLAGTHGNLLTIMVVDIGAFTTDLAKLTFDFSEPADGLRALRQESYALGVINELDKPLFQEIEKRHGFSWSAHSFNDMEGCKSNLYQNKPHPLLTHVKGVPVTLELGTGEDIELIASVTKRFATDVWDKIKAFATGEVPSHIYLTGGGSRIKNVAETLRTSILGSGMRVISVENCEDANGVETQRPWRQTGEGLQRLATAVGGASVLLQEAAAPLQQDRSGIQERLIAGPPAGYKTCRCQGGNKDCCFCGGRGFYPQS
jgi:hypothetical protein